MKKNLILGAFLILILGLLPVNYALYISTLGTAMQTVFYINAMPAAGGEGEAASDNTEAFFDDSLYVKYYAQSNIEVKQEKLQTEKLPLQFNLPNDPYTDRQWYVKNNGTFTRFASKAGADIGLLQAWELEDGDSLVTVAVLDGGCDIYNADLKGRIWKNAQEIPFNNIDDDLNGYVDDTIGWDFVNADNFPEDEAGHGTNVAGIIGANANNNIAYAGIDKNCKLMICKITDDEGNGKYRNWAAAIYYAVKNGARVINMSVGGLVSSKELETAINFAYENNVLVVAAMMNTNTSQPYFPAAYKNVLAVGATNPDDSRAAPFFWSKTSGSNYGQHISVVAPGNYIYGLSPTSDNIFWGGTSQAAPMVSGLAALLIAQDMSRTPDEIQHIITITADDKVGTAEEDTDGWDQYYGYGRINAYRALQYNYFPRAIELQVLNNL